MSLSVGDVVTTPVLRGDRTFYIQATIIKIESSLFHLRSPSGTEFKVGSRVPLRAVLEKRSAPSKHPRPSKGKTPNSKNRSNKRLRT